MGLLIGLQNLRELPPLKKALEGPERAILRRALELCGGSRKKTAQMLGLNRTTLFNKMRKYGLMEVSAATSHGPTAPTSSSTNGTPDRAPAGGQDRESA
jgi:hypothetical protein